MVFGLILSVASFLCSTLWFLSHFAIFLIHYFFVLLVLLLIASKFIKLKSVDLESLLKIFSPNSFPVSYLGSIFDVPENTKASFEYVSVNGIFIDFLFTNILHSFRAALTRVREFSSALTSRPTVKWWCSTSKRWRRRTFTSTSANFLSMRSKI